MLSILGNTNLQDKKTSFIGYCPHLIKCNKIIAVDTYFAGYYFYPTANSKLSAYNNYQYNLLIKIFLSISNPNFNTTILVTTIDKKNLTYISKFELPLSIA